jgi:hypothetical protein
VNLDKPALVAQCASGQGDSCSDGGKKDAAFTDSAVVGQDSAPFDLNSDDSYAPTADTQAAADSSPAYDAGSTDRADANPPNGVDGSADTVPDGADTVSDGAKPDALIAEDAPPDGVPPADLPAADVPAKPDTQADLAVADADANTTPTDSGSSSITTFTSGKGVGVMTGYGWASLGTADTLTSPTCGTPPVPITGSALCASQPNWNSSTALCMVGVVPKLSSPTEAASNWGVEVGVNAKAPPAVLGKSFKTIAVGISGTPTSNLRIVLHRAIDSDAISYCASWTSSDTAVSLTSFNTSCWDGTGTPFATADIPKIDKVSIQSTPSTTADTAVNLCLDSITFGN